MNAATLGTEAEPVIGAGDRRAITAAQAERHAAMRAEIIRDDNTLSGSIHHHGALSSVAAIGAAPMSRDSAIGNQHRASRLQSAG